MGIKLSPKEFGALRDAAGRLPVATWMRGRALDAVEVRGTRASVHAHLAQAKALSDRAHETLSAIGRTFEARIAEVDRVLSRLKGARAVAAARGRPARGGRRERARRVRK